jgi:hypothetical protein
VKDEDVTVGIPDSDVHVYVTWSNEPDSGYYAYAGFCVMGGVQGGPTFGAINFNYALISI